jgi:hypothetical protein
MEIIVPITFFSECWSHESLRRKRCPLKWWLTQSKILESDTRLLCRIRTMSTRFLEVVCSSTSVKCTERELKKTGLVQKYDNKIANNVGKGICWKNWGPRKPSQSTKIMVHYSFFCREREQTGKDASSFWRVLITEYQYGLENSTSILLRGKKRKEKENLKK